MNDNALMIGALFEMESLKPQMILGHSCINLPCVGFLFNQHFPIKYLNNKVDCNSDESWVSGGSVEGEVE